MADTELQQLIIYVGTTAQINAAIQAGTITENDLAISTDAPDFQEKLNQVQMDAVNSGITVQLVSLYNTHVADTTIHVTAQDKTTWNGKQNALNTTQLNAVNSGITSAGVSQITTNKNNIATETTNRQNADNNLQGQINDLKARGRYLALWNCATGLAQSNPPQSPYTYKAGDYFIVGTVATGSGTNYRPSGSSYTTGVASTTVETEAVAVNDVYYYDGSTWSLQINTQKEIPFGSIAGSPYDNTNLSNALNSKQDTLTAGTGVDITNNTIAVDFSEVATAAQGSLADTAVQPETLNDYVTLNTAQKIQAAKAIFGTDVAFGTDQSQKNLLAVISNSNSTGGTWIGRMSVGAKNKTFIIGTYGTICVLGAHSWTNAQQGTGAAWEDVYINPDGDKCVYIGGSPINNKQAILKIQNVNANTTGTVKINRSLNLTNNFKDVACWDDNVSKFNNDAGYITSAATFYWGE